MKPILSRLRGVIYPRASFRQRGQSSQDTVFDCLLSTVIVLAIVALLALILTVVSTTPR